MTLLQSGLAKSLATGPYTIDQSLRFDNGDSAYLSWTPSAGNRKTFTISVWAKITTEETKPNIFGTGVDADEYAYFGINSNKFSFGNKESAGVWTTYLQTGAVQRDPSSWYHFLAKVDTNQATEADRVVLYINGEDQVNYLTSTNYPDRYADLLINAATAHKIGYDSFGDANYWDGYLAEFHFIDGTALDADSFGETDSDTNQWKPIKYTGSYGTNGFYQKYQDSSALGDDSSGNGNDFTVTNLTAYDQMLDSPSNNWCVISPMTPGGSNNVIQYGTMSEGNLKWLSTATGYGCNQTTMATPKSGKWYCEFYWNAFAQATAYGVASVWDVDASYPDDNGCAPQGGSADNSSGYPNWDGYSRTKTLAGSYTAVSYGETYDVGDLMSIALDVTAGKVWYAKNGTWQDSGDPAAGTDFATEGLTPANFMFGVSDSGNGATEVGTWTANFGQDSSFAGAKTSGSASAADSNGYGDFYYTPPTDFLALCNNNLPDPEIADPTDHFNTKLYTGTGSELAITGVGFQPDFTWIKQRSIAWNHRVFDVVRGVTEELYTNDDDAEVTDAQSLKTFDSDGFTLGTSSGVNPDPASYTADMVSWNWKGDGVSGGTLNQDGSIDSYVNVNTTAGFSIVKYVGNNTAGTTIGHGLSQTPDLIAVKDRTSAYSWKVGSPVMASTLPWYYWMQLNDSEPAVNGGADIWDDTAPTASVFTIGDHVTVNTDTDNFIAYCFHSVEGYSKIGSYSGDSSLDGVFLYTGFRPAMVIIKMLEPHTYDWLILDNKREADHNVVSGKLYPDLNSAEDTGTYLDFVSNGIKLRDNSYDINHSSATYLYMAFAETPFKTANAR